MNSDDSQPEMYIVSSQPLGEMMPVVMATQINCPLPQSSRTTDPKTSSTLI